MAEMAKPLQLIRCDSNGQFIVGEEACEALKKVRGPVGVVTVCGRARQGKSFILNQLASSGGVGHKGFEVANTHRPCTKGLWMWSAPIPRTTPEGRPFHLVLLDTEGIDAYDQTGQYSIQIFSLAVLLSSMFIYNQMGGIDEAALDRLSLVTEMTKHIQVRAERARGGETGSSAGELGQFSPSFLWLLRDFYLDLSEDGHKITARDYLETALRPVPNNSDAAQAKNQIRESISSLFPNRDCFTLVRPMNEEKALQNMSSLPSSDLRPEFRSGVELLLQRIFRSALPKSLGTTEMNGPMLAGLAEMYANALNNGAVPTIASAWQGVAEGECRRALEAGEDAYAEHFDESVPPEEAALQAAHNEALEVAMSVFDDNAVGDQEIRRAYADRLRNSVQRRFTRHCETAFALAAAAATEALGQAQQQLQGLAWKSDATPGDIVQEVLGQFEKLKGELKGPAKWEKLCGYLSSTALSLVAESAERSTQEATSRVEAAEAQAHAHQTQAHQASEEARKACSERDAALESAAAAEAHSLQADQDRQAAQQTCHLAQTCQADMECQLAEAQRQVAELTEQLAREQRTAHDLQCDMDHQNNELESLHAEVEEVSKRRRAEAERATQAEVALARSEGVCRGLEAELAHERAERAASVQREAQLKKRLESGKLRGQTFDSCLAQFQMEALAAAKGNHTRAPRRKLHKENVRPAEEYDEPKTPVSTSKIRSGSGGFEDIAQFRECRSELRHAQEVRSPLRHR